MNEFLPGSPASLTKGRGWAVISPYELKSMAARDKKGKLETVYTENVWNTLDPMTALMIYQKCSPVFGIVSGRANKISSLDWHIVCDSDEEQIDKMTYHANNYKQQMEEIDGLDMFSLGRKIGLYQELRKLIPDIRPDLANFNTAHYRQVKRARMMSNEKKNEIQDFFSNPSPGVLWTDFIKTYVQDLLIHGRAAIYKKCNQDGIMQTIHVLPGGTVMPVRSKFVGEYTAYVQILYANTTEPQLFYMDEISFAQYMPNSGVVLGMCPIDALVNMVTENMLFDNLSAVKADGSTPPEKMIVFGEKDPGLDLGVGDISDPIGEDEQKRIENKLNRVKRENAIATLTGYGTPMVLDLSRADTYPTQMARQDQIKKFIGLVYNASNMELNESGGDGTSGRSTSETQERIENAKAVRPQCKIIEGNFSHEIIPYKFGFGYRLEFESPMSELEMAEIATKKVSSGVWTQNEVRTEMSLDPLHDSKYDDLRGQASDSEKQSNALEQIQQGLNR